MSWDENTLLQAIERVNARAERAERMLRRAELEYGARLRKRANRRCELRHLHKAVQRYSAMYREQVLRSSQALEIERASKTAMAKCLHDAVEYLRVELQTARVRIAELEGR